jgi:DnaK suppressor protein
MRIKEVRYQMDTATARKRLEEIRSELDRSISVLKGEQPQDERILDYPQDPADAGANLSESERTEAILAVAKMQRSEVLNALRRIELGTYGTCVDCGAPVPEGRLEAKPEAARCVTCQAKSDRLRR